MSTSTGKAARRSGGNRYSLKSSGKSKYRNRPMYGSDTARAIKAIRVADAKKYN